MRLVAASALVAIALTTVPAHAQETECLFGPNVVGTDGTGREHCEFEAQDLPAHGYVALTPNGFRVYLDRNDNDRFDGRDDELIFTRPVEGNASVVGPLTLETGTVYDVDLYEDCTPVGDPICGWVGTLLVA